jgi:hypothetical protein
MGIIKLNMKGGYVRISIINIFKIFTILLW